MEYCIVGIPVPERRWMRKGQHLWPQGRLDMKPHAYKVSEHVVEQGYR